MLLANRLPEHGAALEDADAAFLDAAAAQAVATWLDTRPDHRPTPMRTLPALAKSLGIGALYVKDEGQRLGLGSFKALGGAYAVVRLALEEAERKLGRAVGFDEIETAEVRAVTAGMVFGCATDGNHGRSVAQGATSVGARSKVFVHAGVSETRIVAIANLGADMVRVTGSYDDSVVEAARVCAENGWITVSDTAWPGYERIPGLVMQGYTAIPREALAVLPAAPTHVFIQAGVGGIAAAMAGYLQLRLSDARPKVIVVEPARAACLLKSARAGQRLRIANNEPTVMAMLECYEPSLTAWRILARTADAFMTVGEDAAVTAMRRLARPEGADPAITAGESGGAGLAGLLGAAADPDMRAALNLDADARVLVINTEGATDPERYRSLVAG